MLKYGVLGPSGLETNSPIHRSTCPDATRLIQLDPAKLCDKDRRLWCSGTMSSCAGASLGNCMLVYNRRMVCMQGLCPCQLSLRPTSRNGSSTERTASHDFVRSSHYEGTWTYGGIHVSSRSFWGHFHTTKQLPTSLDWVGLARLTRNCRHEALQIFSVGISSSYTFKCFVDSNLGPVGHYGPREWLLRT